MCHLLLALPILALPVFWLWPLSLAVPIYAVVILTSLSIYVLLLRAMKRPVQTGREEMLHATGTVLGATVLEPTGRKAYRVRVHSEEWLASCDTVLVEGERVQVTDVDGMVLKVTPEPTPEESKAAQSRRT